MTQCGHQAAPRNPKPQSVSDRGHSKHGNLLRERGSRIGRSYRHQLKLTGRRGACLLRTRSPHNPSGSAPMPKLYEALAEAFLAEGVDTQFVLLGDGNMHWSTAFAKLPDVET